VVIHVGVTGHQRLDDDGAWTWVRAEIARELRALADDAARDGHRAPALVGVSSLAAGADQVFSETVLELGGRIDVIAPFADVLETFTTRDARETYLRLSRRARHVHVLPRSGSDQECYMAAGRLVVDLAGIIFAVWNGLPARGLGGTADVVAYARSTNVPVVCIDPITRRTRRT